MWVIKFKIHRELTGDFIRTKTHKYTSREKAEEACNRYNSKGPGLKYWVEEVPNNYIIQPIVKIENNSKTIDNF